jgi:hypothetical protein
MKILLKENGAYTYMSSTLLQIDLESWSGWNNDSV